MEQGDGQAMSRHIKTELQSKTQMPGPGIWGGREPRKSFGQSIHEVRSLFRSSPRVEGDSGATAQVGTLRTGPGPWWVLRKRWGPGYECGVLPSLGPAPLPLHTSLSPRTSAAGPDAF